MESYTLPPISKSSGIELLHFPTRLHAFVFRNWEFVPLKKLAVVLGTTEQNVKELAALMGLPEQSDICAWETRGYITVIKQNWHLLPYSQLMQLLDITADELGQIMDLNEDSLNWTYSDGWWYYNTAIKSGEMTKPLFDEVTFSGPHMDNRYQLCTVVIDVNAQAVQQANNGESVWEALGWPEN